jgi:hypothetical protein
MQCDVKKALGLLLACTLVAGSGWAQKDKKAKPWTEWSRKDAAKMLTDSPWARTQVIADATEVFSGGGSAGGSGRRGSRMPTVDQSVPIDIYSCILSAKPVRQAWARRIELEQNPTDEFKAQLRKFVEADSDEWITISVTFHSPDTQINAMAARVFNSARTEKLKEETYLELKNGKRVALEEYAGPAKDFLGARFRFKKMVDGQPFITPDSGELRFHSRLTETLVLNSRFKVSDFMYEGVFEY